MPPQATFNITGTFNNTQIIAGAQQMGAAFVAAHQQIQSAANASSQSFKNVYQNNQRGISANHMREMMNGAREIGHVWKRQIESMDVYVDEALKFAAAQGKFQVLNLGEAENQRALAAVRNIVATVKGTNLTDTMETLTDVHTAIGSLHEAIAALPMAAKYRFGFEAVFGDKFSKEQVEQQIQAGMKYLEVTGAVAQGEAEMEKRFNVLAQMTAGSSGRTTPTMMLQMARRAGPAAQGLSVQGIRNMSGLVQELGGEGTGTALMSLYQALVAGKMKQAEAGEFARLGLIDPHKIVFGHGQKIKSLMPNANKLASVMQEDPLKAADMLMYAMAHPLKGPAIDTTNMNKVREELAILFGNRTAQKMMSILTTQRKQIVKESHLAEMAKDIEQTYEQALGSPAGKLQAYENNLRNLQAEIGGPLLSALTSIASAAIPFLRIAAAHPNIALTTLMVVKLSSALVQMGIIARASGLTGFISNLFGGSATVGAASAGGLAAGAAYAGAVAIPLVAIAYVIKGMLDSDENDERAAQAGERIAKYLSERFTKQIEGKLSGEVQKELDKAAAPALAKDIIESQGLDTAGHDIFGAKHSEFVRQLEAFGPQSVTTNIKPGKEAEQQRRDAWMDMVWTMRGTTGITSATQLDEYLRQSQRKLESKGQPELYPILERLARDSFPQFEAELDKLRQIGPAAESAAEALKRLTSAAEQMSLFPSPVGPFAPPIPQPFQKKGAFNFSGMRGYAKGGIALTEQIARVAERGPEAMLPLHLLNNVRGGKSIGAPSIVQHFQVSVSGDASMSQVKAAVRAAAEEGKGELFREMMRWMDDQHKDIGMGT